MRLILLKQIRDHFHLIPDTALLKCVAKERNIKWKGAKVVKRRWKSTFSVSATTQWQQIAFSHNWQETLLAFDRIFLLLQKSVHCGGGGVQAISPFVVMRDKLCLAALDKQGRNAKMKMSSSREKYLEHVFHGGMSDLIKNATK